MWIALRLRAGIVLLFALETLKAISGLLLLLEILNLLLQVGLDALVVSVVDVLLFIGIHLFMI